MMIYRILPFVILVGCGGAAFESPEAGACWCEPGYHVSSPGPAPSQCTCDADCAITPDPTGVCAPTDLWTGCAAPPMPLGEGCATAWDVDGGVGAYCCSH